MTADSNQTTHGSKRGNGHFFRFHHPHVHLHSLFGDDWFALKAEKFARFFGTPVFLIIQTVIVGVWMVVNLIGWTQFDVYPFILLNLAFSLQAAYAAPLILLAQTRQADRDRIRDQRLQEHRDAENARHDQYEARQAELLDQDKTMSEQHAQMLAQNTALTEQVAALTRELHDEICKRGKAN